MGAALGVAAVTGACDNPQLDQVTEEAREARGGAAAGLEARELPRLALPDVDGDTTRLQETLGRRGTLVNFWATWCVPCKREMPALVEIHRDYRRRGIQVVGIAVASPDTGRVRDWVREYDVTFPVLRGMTGGELVDFTGWDAVPTTLVVDGAGTVRDVMFGARSREELVSALDPLLSR